MGWKLGMFIGLTFIEICNELENNGKGELIPEFKSGLDFLNKSNVPVKIMVLYLQEYMKKGELK